MTKYVYTFGAGKADGRADMKNLLGGKGANLAEMNSIGLPVPAGRKCLINSWCISKLFNLEISHADFYQIGFSIMADN